MTIHSYKTAGGKDLILEYINHLSNAEKVDGLSVLECIEQDRMEELTIKPWQGKVWEVYFKKHNRIFYVAIDRDDIYLLFVWEQCNNKTCVLPRITHKNIKENSSNNSAEVV